MRTKLRDCCKVLARISHRLTVEARNRRAVTSLRLLAVLDVLSSTPPLVKQRAPRTDAPLTHFASPSGEKSGLAVVALLAALAVSVSAQSFKGFQAASVAPPELITLSAGQQATVPLTIRIRPGYHINANKPAEEYLIATRLTWDHNPLELTAVLYPEAESVKYSFSPKPLLVYSGNVTISSTFSVPETIPSELGELTGTLLYQACNDKSCFRPQKIRVKVATVAE